MKGRLVLAALALGVIAWANLSLPAQYETMVGPAQGHRTRADVVLDLLGEARTVLARIMWFKMDLYHEILDVQGVPNEKQGEVLPLLRLVTLLDPHIEDAYDTLARDLFKGQDKRKEALELLAEGIAYNPESWMLRFRRGQLLYYEERYTEAALSLRDSLAYCKGELDALNTYRLLFQCHKKRGDLKRASLALSLIFKLRPGDRAAVLHWQDIHAGDPPPHEVEYPQESPATAPK